MKRILLFTIALFVFGATGLYAQNVPQGINYQTIVRGSTNAPMTDVVVSFLFQMRDGSGNLVYAEKQSKLTNSNGLVNLIVGQGTPLNNTNFQSIDWSTGPKTLTISYESSPDVFDELGTMQLMSVPYALYAAKSNVATTAEKLSNLGAQTGQVLIWNGTAWAPVTLPLDGDTDATNELQNWGNLPGIPAGFADGIDHVNDADADPNNEIQQLSLVGNELNLLPGGGTVTLPTGTTYTAGTAISINGTTINNTGDTDPTNDLTTGSTAAGDVTGLFSNLQITAAAVGTTELSDKAVTGVKLNNMAASSGQVLKFDGTNWGPGIDNGASYTAGTAISINGNTINNTGDTDPTNDLTTGSTAAGDVTGLFSNLQIVASAVGTTELSDKAVTGVKLNNMAASNGQVLKFDGTNWGPGIDNGASYTAGTAISINGTTINNTGDTDPTNDLTTGSTAAGDVTGLFSNLQIAANTVGTSELSDKAVTGVKLNNMAASTGQVLKFDGTNWGPGADNGASYTAGTAISINGTTINNTGDTDPSNDLTTSSNAAGDVTGLFSNLQIAAGAVGTSELANGAVTATKLNQMGASTNQVLQWNGTAWAPATLSGGGSIQTNCGRLVTTGDVGILENSGDCPDDAYRLTVRAGAKDGVYIDANGGGDVLGMRLEANGGSNSNDGVIFLARSANNTSNGVKIATNSDNPGAADITGIRLVAGGDEGDFQEDGNGFSQNVGINIDLKDRVNTDIGLFINDEHPDGNWAIYTNGDIRGRAFFQPSDQRLKENITPMASALYKVLALQPFSYNYISDPAKKTTTGFLAQDVERLFPDLVMTTKSSDDQAFLALNYAGFSVVAIKAIQEQQQIIETQQAKITSQEARLNALEKEMAAIKALLQSNATTKSRDK